MVVPALVDPLNRDVNNCIGYLGLSLFFLAFMVDDTSPRHHSVVVVVFSDRCSFCHQTGE